MSQEISGAAKSAINLRRGGVKPLRGAGLAPESRSMNVEDLKNGGSLNLGGLVEKTSPGEEARTLRQAAGGRQEPKTSPRHSRSAGLSLSERLEKLAQIRKSATEYEALFVDQLVKLMRPSPLAKTPGSDLMSEMAEQPFRDYLSRAGGLGLANTIVSQLARQEGLEQTLHEHPEVMGPTWRPAIPKNIGPKHYRGLSLTPPGLEAQGLGTSSDLARAAETGRGEDAAETAGHGARSPGPYGLKREDEHGYPSDT